jgi:hypothetical protein
MYKKAKSLFFCMIFVANGVFCQSTVIKKAVPVNFFSIQQPAPANKNIAFHNYLNKPARKLPMQPVINLNKVIRLNPVSCSVINANFYTQGFGFFCKKELQFEKATKIPFKFRLGTLQYNDYLEGKINSGVLPPY